MADFNCLGDKFLFPLTGSQLEFAKIVIGFFSINEGEELQSTKRYDVAVENNETVYLFAKELESRLGDNEKIIFFDLCDIDDSGIYFQFSQDDDCEVDFVCEFIFRLLKHFDKNESMFFQNFGDLYYVTKNGIERHSCSSWYDEKEDEFIKSLHKEVKAA
jgi:hypothetical protein